MKQFKVGERVAFTYNGVRLRGEIFYIYGKYCDIQRTSRHYYGVKLDEANIKRLVKKKRLTIYINDCKHYFSSIYSNKGEAIMCGKKSATYVRTIKFVESKEK